jgi:AcrR family transcriptional regulator
MERSTVAGSAAGAAPPDRRTRRRQETIDEILAIAVEVMTEEGVTGLSVAEVARRLGVRPPSLYKYFHSRMAIYDELFRRGAQEHLAIMRDAMAVAQPGLPALTAGLEAGARWLLANGAIAQLLFWRPVPSFEPSAEAFAPSIEMVALQRDALRDAVAAGELGRDADSDQAVFVVATMIAGVLTQTMANEPDVAWGEGRFTPAFPKLMSLLPVLYPTKPTKAGARRR